MPTPAEAIAAALAAMEAAVTEDETVDGSATQLILLLATQFEAAKNAPAQIQLLVDRIRATTGSLSAAVVANTPAAEEPPPTP